MATVFKRGGKANRTGYWYVSWFDHTGKRRSRCTKTTDKAAADRIAAKLESDAALRRDGVIDAAIDATAQESRRSIESHLVDFRAKLEAASRSTNHVDRTCRMVRSYDSWAAHSTVGEVTAESVNLYVAKLKSDGLSSRTIQANLTAIKSFTKWLSERHKLHRDPLTSVRKPNPKTDRRHERRALLRDEWRCLIRATEAGPVRYGMPAAERSLLYRLAVHTGLRSNELRSLGRSNLFLEASPPFVTCDAGSAKNRKTARQFIDIALAARLDDLQSQRQPGETLFSSLPHETDVADMIKDDLSEARRQWIEAAGSPAEEAERIASDFLSAKDHDGKVLDFHALRHTCGAWLALAGVQPKVIQTIMRHSTITLTMDAYGHLFPGQESDASAKLSLMLDDSDVQQQAQQLGDESPRIGASVCEGRGTIRMKRQRRKPLQVAALFDGVPPDANECESRPGGIRTHDQGIMSPIQSVSTAEKYDDSESRAAVDAAVDADCSILKLASRKPR